MMKWGIGSAVPTIAGLVVAATTVSLGNWQMSRADEKRQWQERIEAGMVAVPQRPGAEAELEAFAPVLLFGSWVHEASILLDNRVYEGRPGFHVYAPLELADGSGWVLVNRGWLPAALRRDQLPTVPQAGVAGELLGHVRIPESRPYTLAQQAGDGRLWQYLDLEAYRAWSGLPVSDWVVFQHSETGEGLVRDWPRPDGGIDRHRGYALQWYSFALISLLLTGFHVFRSLKAYVVRPHA